MADLLKYSNTKYYKYLMYILKITIDLLKYSNTKYYKYLMYILIINI